MGCLSDVERAGRIVDAVMAEHAVRGGLTAAAWGVVAGGDLVWSGGAGNHGRPDAAYRIASMTKSFTAATVLALRDEGRLSLDEPIVAYAPELAKVAGPTRDAAPVTVRHLLTMSSGLAHDDPWLDRHLDATDEELDGWLAPGVRLVATPGTRFEYSSLGYALIARVVQRVTGRRAQVEISDRFLGPLGMGDTTWTAPAGAVPGRVGDGPDAEVVPMVADGVVAPMGGLYSTVADVARWVAFFLDAVPARDDPDDGPLRRASLREMQQPARPYEDGTGAYGMGLAVLRHARLGTVVSHSGGLPGYGSNMRWVPSAGVGFVAFGDRTYAPMGAALADAIDALVAAGLLASVARNEPDEALARAAEALVALHGEWDPTVATTLFADNVMLDTAEDERRRAAADLVERYGPFRFARVEVASPCDAVAVAHGPAAELRIEFQLTPHLPPRVLEYEAKISG